MGSRSKSSGTALWRTASHLAACLLTLSAISTSARGDTPPRAFVRVTCIPEAQYFAIDYKAFPDEMFHADERAVDNALRKRGYRIPAGLVVECKLPQSTYAVLGSQTDCGARVSIRQNGEELIKDVTFGGTCSEEVYLTSLEIWDGNGERSPGWTNLCFSRNDEAAQCSDYEPHPAQKLTLPPITQEEAEAFLAARTNPTLGNSEWVRSAGSLTDFMFHRYPCEFPSPGIGKEVEIVAAVGGKADELPFQIEGTGEQAYVKEVFVNIPTRPIALALLGSGDPTVWNVHWTNGTRIVAVAAYGSRRQAVAGLPSEVPIFAPYFGSGHACKYWYWETSRPNFPILSEREEINSAVKQLLGRPPDTFLSLHQGNVAVGPAPARGADFVQSSVTSVESFKIQTPRPSTDQILELAVKAGQLRAATQKDVQDWRAVVARAVASGQKVRPIAKDWDPILYRAYVVLQAFTFPPDLFGGNLATFFVPKGVPLPRGDRGHSVLLDFNTLKCASPHKAMCGYY